MGTGNHLPPPAAAERAEMARRHLDRMVAIKGEQVAVKEMRKQLAWYLKGTSESSSYRARCNQLSSHRQAHALVDDWLRHAVNEAPAWT
jgi:tRNA-dihydrouridine synthase